MSSPDPGSPSQGRAPHLAALERRLSSGLRALEHKGRLRQLDGPKGIDLSSNDYLGLADHPTVRAALEAALAEGIPLGSGGSRLLRGNTDWHMALEAELAQRLGREAVLIFNSGYEANVGLISTLVDAGDLVFADRLVHASMLDGIRESKAACRYFSHNDPQDLERHLQEAPSGKTRFILVESLYSMDGDRAPLEALAELAERYQAFLIVDEAHATGLFGERAMGLLDKPELRNAALASIHTCGKAWAGFGAFVACSSLIRNYLINRCRPFIFTTALPPLILAQWRAALRVIDEEPARAARALAHAENFRNQLRDLADLGKSDSQIVPLILGSDQAAVAMAEGLRAEGYDVRAIRPPTVPRGSARLRLAFNAKLTTAHVDRLACLCKNHLAERTRFALPGFARPDSPERN